MSEFKKGDVVEYTGTDPAWQGATGEILDVHFIYNPNGSVTFKTGFEHAPECTASGHELTPIVTGETPAVDMVNHPPHYTWLPNGLEVIDITENLGFRLGNTVKYILRADQKGKPIEDLKKALWYLEREIAKREA